MVAGSGTALMNVSSSKFIWSVVKASAEPSRELARRIPYTANSFSADTSKLMESSKVMSPYGMNKFEEPRLL